MPFKYCIRVLFFSVAGLVFAAPLATALPLPTVLTPTETFRVDGGLIQGKVLKSGVRAWLGVPYAAPPLRNLRWRPPQPVQPWNGVYHADRFAPECMQSLRGSHTNHYFGNEAISEDCLYLNVWAPSGDRSDRPVVVWIYGGGFGVGSTAMRSYSGKALAAKGVVFVSMNYRLGPFGFMAHPALTQRSETGASGDYGMLDQVAALEWVRRNIKKFGGDPDNVTIIGQSAGSMSVSMLQASPLAEGLFDRAMGMSGSVLVKGDKPGGMESLDDAEKKGLRLQKLLSAESISAMRTLPPDVVLRAAQENHLRFGPNIDGYFMPAAPIKIFSEGRQNDVPILIGFTKDEAFSPLSRVHTKAEYEAKAKELFGKRADEFLELYPVEGNLTSVARRAGRDSSVALLMWNWALLQSETGHSPVYVYLYAHHQPFVPGIPYSDFDPQKAGVYHASDIPFWLDNLSALNRFRKTRDWNRQDRRLASELSNAIVRFAQTGSPSKATLTWPKFDSESPQLMKITDTLGVAAWPDYKNFRFFKTEAE